MQSAAASLEKLTAVEPTQKTEDQMFGDLLAKVLQGGTMVKNKCAPNFMKHIVFNLFSRYELKIYILKNKKYINGPIWTENPDFSKSSAENISRRKYVVNFMFAHNVHVIEV